MWSLSSRAHQLNHFPQDDVVCYVKRDDELGCGISGTKLRKYASLMPCLLERGIQHLLIIAGTQSNNLLAALQMAREYQLQVTALLLKPKHEEVKGNFKLSSLFLKPEEIIWIERENWPEVEEIAKSYLKKSLIPAFILKEGASVSESLPGAMTLADDILCNEDSLGVKFQHVFIDAGTGFSAAAFIKGMTLLHHQAFIHVLLLADNEEIFKRKLQQWIGTIPLNFQCLLPKTAKSFGSVNQMIKDEIKRLALEEGILADPIYAAKLFFSARTYIQEEKIKGNVLIVHSGGTLSMPGFS
jgi:1-aminocyclopropane-1-carboxylate deaminase